MKLKFGEVKEVVDKYDIVGMIYEGGGSDEYDFETQDIVDRSDTVKTIDELESVVISVFEEAFDKEVINTPERNVCKRIASEIWDLRLKEEQKPKEKNKSQ